MDFFRREDGIVVKDGDYSICLEYDDNQKAQYKEIALLKERLSESDYKALKYADGALSEEEYAPIKAERQAWRDRINEIEKDFKEPTITPREMLIAERIAFQKYGHR